MNDNLQIPYGVFPAIATPFDENYHVDFTALRQHIDEVLSAGANGAFLLGTTGEANSIALSERIGVISHFEGCYEPNQLMFGIGTPSLSDTLLLAKTCLKAGYNHMVCLPPFYYKSVDIAGLYRYYAELIERVADNSLRLYLYHIPQVSNVAITHELLQRLQTDFKGIVVGIKDSSPDFASYAKPLLRSASLRFFTGRDNLLLDSMQAGGAGCITALANIVPALSSSLITAYRQPAGLHQAQIIQQTLTQHRDFFEQYPMIAAIKHVLKRRTANPAWGRLLPPLTELSAVHEQQIDAFMRQQ